MACPSFNRPVEGFGQFITNGTSRKLKKIGRRRREGGRNEEEWERREGKAKSKSLDKHHNEQNHPPHEDNIFNIFLIFHKKF
jgi:hypothetical protein